MCVCVCVRVCVCATLNMHVYICVPVLCMDVHVLHVRVHEGRCEIKSHFIPTEVHHFYLYSTCECMAALLCREDVGWLY